MSDMNQVMNAREVFDKKLQEFETSKAQLFRPDGKPRYTEVEHQERLNELLAPVQQAAATVQQVAEAAKAAAKRELTKQHLDPISSLLDHELARANHLRPFIQDAVTDATLPELAATLESVAEHGTRAEMTVYLRAARRKVEAVRVAMRTDKTVDTDGITYVTEAMATLAAKLVDPKKAKTIADAEQLARVADGLINSTGSRLRDVDGTHEKWQQRTNAMYQKNF